MIGLSPRRTMVPCLMGALALTALGVAPIPAPAQTVRGEVVEESGGSPVSSATVLLLDAGGQRVAGTFTDERGRFALRAAAPGTLTVRVLRIGFRSTESPSLTLGAGEVREVRLVASQLPTQLAAVRITERTRCESRPGEGEVVGQLWEEVRKALLATVIAQETRLVRMRFSYYERDLHPMTLRPAPEHRWATEGVSNNPFVTLPPEQLARHGFVQRDGDFNVYYGPDARLLLSDEFLAGHCLRAVPAPKDAPGLVGIGFEPQGDGNLPDVKGTLWLDEKTFELKHLDFEYVRLAQTLPPGRAGGRVEFGRLPSGAWIVQRWYIRMPQMSERQSSGGLLPGAASTSALRSVANIIERGGEVGAVESRVAVAAARPAPPSATGASAGAPAASAPVHAAPAVHASAVAAAAPDSTAQRLSVVRVEASNTGLAGTGFDERRARGSGYFMTRDQIQRRRAGSLMDLLRSVPGAMIVRSTGGARDEVLQLERGAGLGRSGQLSPALVRRLSSSDTSRASTTAAATEGAVDHAGTAICSALYFVDGQEVDVTGTTIDVLVPVSEVVGIEAYRNAQAPPQFRRSREHCGVVVIWTRASAVLERGR